MQMGLKISTYLFIFQNQYLNDFPFLTNKLLKAVVQVFKFLSTNVFIEEELSVQSLEIIDATFSRMVYYYIFDFNICTS